MTGDGKRPGGDADESLVGVLARLTDPATSTRRTASARQRLADHPTTRALLDAGVRVLLQEVGASSAPSRTDAADAADAAAADAAEVPARFFELLSASRVCAAATAVGPLQVTPAHLRDRWSRQADFVADLFAFVLWHQHWADALAQRHSSLPVPRHPGDLPRLADAIAEADLLTSTLPVTLRLEVVASALAPARPRFRASRAVSYARLDSLWVQVLVELLGGAGLRPRAGYDVTETASALGALLQGANQRLLALGESPQRRAEAVRLVSVGLQGLWRSGFEPVPSGGAVLPGRAVPPCAAAAAAAPHLSLPRPAPGDVAEVLTRMTDEATGTRRTEEARRRLARDGITRQLLEGGLGVLGRELGVASMGLSRQVEAVGGGPSRFFDVLSVARVVTEARAAGGTGAEVTSAQLRDRWASQEHYIDDLLGYAVSRVQPGTARLMDQVSSTTADPTRAASAAAQTRLRGLEGAAEVRLRLLLTALAQTRPAVTARLAQLHAEEEATICGVVEHITETTGRRLLPGLDLADLCRAQAALGEGLVVRALATGDTGLDDDGQGSLLLRTSRALYRGSLAGTPPRPA